MLRISLLKLEQKSSEWRVPRYYWRGYCSLLLKKSTFNQFILSLSQTNPRRSGGVRFVLGSWWSGAKWWSFSPDLTLSFFSLKNRPSPSRSTCFAGWWQTGSVGWFVWFGLVFVRLVLCLFWVGDCLWKFWFIWVWVLFCQHLGYYMVFVYVIFERENIIFKWNWNRALYSR